MGIFFRYITRVYLSSFFIIFFSLLSFYVVVDLLVNFKELPSSANIILLYIFFLACGACEQILSLSLIFALVLFMIKLIRQNELVSFYALGFSKNKLILYPLFWSVFITLFFIFLNSTPFAYFSDYKNNIKKHGSIMQASKDVFIKYNNSFIYIKRIKPFSNTLEDVKILKLKNQKLSSITQAKSAYYANDDWILSKAKVIQFDTNLSLDSKPPVIKKQTFLKALQGFEPQFIENIAANSAYSISDAINSLGLFKEQGLNTKEIKINLYKLLFSPFFAPCFIVILYYFFPVITRFFNLALLSFYFFVATLFAWALLFLLARLTTNGVISPEIGIIMPIILLLTYAFYIFYKHRG